MATTQFGATDAFDLDTFYADLDDSNLQPLWLQRGLLTKTPSGLSPHRWDGKSLRRLAEKSGELIGIERGGDRRVLALAHPDLDGLPFATRTLWAAVQYLKGGELAPAHRHSPAALRFVLAGSGVWTLVNGDPIRMDPGDLVLTPSNTWHEHHNPGTEPMIWFDGLDLPLVRSLDAMFYEEGAEELTPYRPAERSAAERSYGQAGLVAVEPAPRSRLTAYRWQQTDAALTALLQPAGASYARVRYTNPVSGQDDMPTMRAEAHRVLAGHRTATTRTVGSAVWVVFRGSGVTVADGRPLKWNAGDILVTPSWAAVDHEATTDADLFMMSDAPVIEALGLGRHTTVPTRQEVGE